MCSACAVIDFRSLKTNVGVTLSDFAKSESAQTQEMRRKASSRLLVQFTPVLGGLKSIHEETSATNDSAYRSSPVSQYACPSVTRY